MPQQADDAGTKQWTNSKKLSLTTAAKKVGVLRKALKYIKDYRGVIPPSLCRLIEEASAVASDLLDLSKQKPRRRLNIIRPGQQAQAGPRGASAPMDAVIPPFSTPVSSFRRSCSTGGWRRGGPSGPASADFDRHSGTCSKH